jgi:hypothetical protein
MSIASLLMAGLMAFVLLVPTLMVAVLVSGLSRRTALEDTPGDSFEIAAAGSVA